MHGCSMLLPLSTSVSPEIGTSPLGANALPHRLLLIKRRQRAPTPPVLQLQRWLSKPDKAETLADGGGGFVTICVVPFSFHGGPRAAARKTRPNHRGVNRTSDPPRR